MESKKDLNSRAVKFGLLFTVCQVFVRGLSFVVTPFYTRILTTDQYGITKIFESWIAILVPIVSLGLFRSAEVAKHDFEERYDEFVGNTIVLGLLLCCVWFVLCITCPAFWGRLFGMEYWMLLIMTAYLFAEFAIMTFNRTEKQLLRGKYITLVTTLLVVFPTLCSCALLLWGYMHNRTEQMIVYRIAGFYIPYIMIGYTVGIVLFMRGHRKERMLSDWRYGISFSVPLVAEFLSIQVMNQIDRIMIDRMIGSSEAGIYALASMVSFIVWILEDSAWGAWLPWLYEKISRKENADIQPLWDKMMWIFAVISWSVILASPELIGILGGKNYWDARYIVPPLILATLFRFYSNSFSAVQNYCKKTRYVAVSTVMVMALNIGLNYFAIRSFGYIGAAYATAVSYFALMALQAFFERRVTGLRVIQVKRTFLTALVTFAVGIGLIRLYPLHFMIRFLLAALLCGVILYQNRAMIPQKFLPRKK